MLRIVFALVLLAATPAIAAEPVCRADREANPVLDELFSELKRESDTRAAGRIAARIWAEWSKSGSDTVDLLIGWAVEAIGREKNEVALDLLDQAIALAPEHAEGWNRRATLNFTMNRYDKSMADIACVLALEPRHFGALSGMAAIYRESGLKQQALNAYLRVLDLYPADRNAQAAAGELAEELAEKAI